MKLTQERLPDNMFKGPQMIQIIVQNNAGKIIDRFVKTKMIALSNNGVPINLVSVTSELQFDKKFSYPL